MSIATIQGGGGQFPAIGSREPDALTLGRLVEKERGVTHKMRYGGGLHTLVFGANGKGKGTRLLIPNLLQMTDSSVVVIDPKGELAAVTAPFRRNLGRVVIINPYNVFVDLSGYQDMRSTGFNPLGNLDPDAPNFNGDAANLAAAFIKIEGNDPHWTSSARSLLSTLIMYAAIEAKEEGGKATIARVRELLCMASGEATKDMPAYGLPALAAEMMKANVIGLRNKAAQFANWNKEIQSIASTARNQTEAFDDDPIITDTSKDGFDFREIKKTPTTVYIVLPADQIDRQSKWLRLVITAALQGVMRARRRGEPRTLFMIDEFFALGHMEIVATVWALVRGYGIQIMPILQSIGQLKSLYPELWETFIGMAGAVAYFSPNELTTAEYLSRRMGDTTRIAKSKTLNQTTSTGSSSNWGSNSGYSPGGASSGTSGGGGHSNSLSISNSENENPVKVPLMPHHELFGLPPGFLMVTLEGLSNVVPVYAPAYYQIRECVERARDNPYYLG